MSLQEPPSTSKLVLRSLQPSLMGTAVSCIFATLIVFGHLFMLSLSAGTIFAGSDDQLLSVAYTNYLVGPILKFLNFSALGLITTAIIWGFTGWLIFTVIERLAHGFHEWRQVEKGTQVTPFQIINHPLRKNYLLRVAWRFGCIIGLVCLLLTAQPILDYVMKINGAVLSGAADTSMLLSILRAIGLLVILEYGVIVLLRLYTFRTRLFGEILY